jgi:tripartite-type tricarboxylate transporter receptor subunit TctC
MELRSVLRHTGTAMLGAALVFGAQAWAEWPEKAVRMIIPFGTGGGTDIQGRLLVDSLRRQTGQNFIIDNRSGAGGLIGAELVVRSRADGYTFLFTTATLAINTTLYSKRLKFKTQSDLIPSTLVSNAPNVLCVHPAVPAKSVQEFVALAKKIPGKMNFGVNTPGSTSHFAGEILAQQAKLDVTIIAYTGGGPAMAGLVTGDIDALFPTGPVAARAIKTGRVRCLAVTTHDKNPAFPDLPPIRTIVPGVEIANWYGMFFPKGTPSNVVNKLPGLIKKALGEKKISAFYKQQALVAVGSSPDQLRARFAADVKKYAAVIKERKIPLR